MITKENKSINYIKKEPLYGSYKGMRYVLQKKDDETMLATFWPEPFCFDKTPDEKKTSKTFPLTEEGRDEALDWLNKQHITFFAK